jgi:hypothetical protein
MYIDAALQGVIRMNALLMYFAIPMVITNSNVGNSGTFVVYFASSWERTNRNMRLERDSETKA